jgi:hypothetical protein
MFVGAVMPRQNTAFALEELKVITAAKDVTAAHSNNNTRIVSSPALGMAHWSHLDWCENGSQGAQCATRPF